MMGVINNIIDAILKCICCENNDDGHLSASPQPSVRSGNSSVPSGTTLPSPHATVRTIGSFTRTAPRYTGAEPERGGGRTIWVPRFM